MGAQYYLKAAFDCGKDQFAVFLLITLIAQSLSQVLQMPFNWTLQFFCLIETSELILL
jgi:hypothetical protein